MTSSEAPSHCALTVNLTSTDPNIHLNIDEFSIRLRHGLIDRNRWNAILIHNDTIVVALSSGTVYQAEEAAGGSTGKTYSISGDKILRLEHPIISFVSSTAPHGGHRTPLCVAIASNGAAQLGTILDGRWNFNPLEGSLLASDMTLTRARLVGESFGGWDGQAPMTTRCLLIALEDADSNCVMASVEITPSESDDAGLIAKASIVTIPRDLLAYRLCPNFRLMSPGPVVFPARDVIYPVEVKKSGPNIFELIVRGDRLSSHRPFIYAEVRSNSDRSFLTKQSLQPSEPSTVLITLDEALEIVAVLLQSGLRKKTFISQRTALDDLPDTAELAEGIPIEIHFDAAETDRLEVTTSFRTPQGDRIRPTVSLYEETIASDDVMDEAFSTNGHISKNMTAGVDNVIEGDMSDDEDLFDAPIEAPQLSTFDDDATKFSDNPTTSRNNRGNSDIPDPENDSYRTDQRKFNGSRGAGVGDQGDRGEGAVWARLEKLEKRLEGVIGKDKQPRSRAPEGYVPPSRWNSLCEVPATEAQGGFRLCKPPEEILATEAQLAMTSQRHLGQRPLFGDLDQSLIHYCQVAAHLDRPHPILRPLCGGVYRRAISASDVTSEVWDVILHNSHIGLVTLQVALSPRDLSEFSLLRSWCDGPSITQRGTVIRFDELPGRWKPSRLNEAKIKVIHNQSHRGSRDSQIPNAIGADRATLGPRGVLLVQSARPLSNFFEARDASSRPASTGDFIEYHSTVVPPTGSAEHGQWSRTLPLGERISAMAVGSCFVAYVTQPANTLIVRSIEGRMIHNEQLPGSIVGLAARESLLLVLTCSEYNKAANYLNLLRQRKSDGPQEVTEALFHEYLGRPDAVQTSRFMGTLYDLSRSRLLVCSTAPFSLSGYESIRWIDINPLGMPVVFSNADRLFGLVPCLKSMEATMWSRRTDEPLPQFEDEGELIQHRWIHLASLSQSHHKNSDRTLLDVVKFNLGLTSATNAKVILPIEASIHHVKVVALPWPGHGTTDHARTDIIFRDGLEDVKLSIQKISTHVPYLPPHYDPFAVNFTGVASTCQPLHKRHRQLDADLGLFDDIVHNVTGIHKFNESCKVQIPDVFDVSAFVYRLIKLQSTYALTNPGCFDAFKGYLGTLTSMGEWDTYFGDSTPEDDDKTTEILENVGLKAREGEKLALQRLFNVAMKNLNAPLLALSALRHHPCLLELTSTVEGFSNMSRTAVIHEMANEEIRAQRERFEFREEMEKHKAITEENTLPVSMFDETQELMRAGVKRRRA